MSSTNKTTNYELSQFIGTDKPAWLSDYNGDMGKIDAGIHSAQTTATGADGKADSNTTKIGTLTNLTTEVKTDLVSAINEVNTTAGTAQNTANTANSNAGTATTKANNALAGLEKFNLNTSVPLTASVSAGNIAVNTLKIQKDSTGSIYKFYGQLFVSGLAGVQGALTITISTDSGLRPSEAYDVDSAILIDIIKTGGSQSLGVRKFSVGTTGTISIPAESLDGATDSIAFNLFPCLYFNTNFGD